MTMTSPLTIMSANLNGIRAAVRKGFLHYLQDAAADIICVQELKAQEKDMQAEMLQPLGMMGYFHYAERPGYSGVGVYSKTPAQQVTYGLGIKDFDQEGRFLRVDFDAFSVVSLYLPSGSHSEERQRIKYAFMEAFLPYLKAMMAEERALVICGDWNIAHQEIDLKNWRANQKNSGFLPEERAWLTQVLDELGWIDVWRSLYADIPGYTWWSYRGRAYDNDVGWRIDYQLATPQMATLAQEARVDRQQRFSDHAPLIVSYQCP